MGNVVQVQLDGGGGEGGQAVGDAEDVFVENHADFGVGKVQPARDLPVRHDVDVVDPRGVHFQRADAVSRGDNDEKAYFSSSLSRKRFMEIEVSLSLSFVLWDFM